MTGFGQSELKSAQGNFRVEIKSVNHKFLEVSVRLPGHVADLEEVIRKKTAQEIRRGKISVFVACPDPSFFSSRLLLNQDLAKEVYQKTMNVKKMLNLKKVSDDALLSEVLNYPDVLVKDTSSDRRSVVTVKLQSALAKALANFNRSRAAEGQALLKDLKNRAEEIRRSLRIIEKQLNPAAKRFKNELKGRMKDFIKEDEIDRERLTIEVAQYLKSSDISEEVTRMKSHLDTLARALREEGELGRKIDFIAQEMTRETNTTGAKSADPVITDAVIAIKSAIEKIREQAQNVE